MRKHGRRNRLGTVAECMIRVIMYFYHDTIGPDSDGCLRQVFYHPSLSRSVAGIHNDRQMALALDGKNSGKVQCIARVGFKCSDSPFTENDIVISPCHNIFCTHEPLFYGRTQAPFQQDRNPCFSQSPEQFKILHIACSDLNDIDAGFYKLIELIQ